VADAALPMVPTSATRAPDTPTDPLRWFCTMICPNPYSRFADIPPKERFISYPFCSREADPSLLIGWAGWDHLQQARALAAWYTDVVEREGWSIERLKPLLAGLAELIPWLKQWQNDLDPEYHERMGDFFETFLQGQLQTYGLTHDDLRHWTPPAVGRPRRSRIR
jgi:hypothetical protein